MSQTPEETGKTTQTGRAAVIPRNVKRRAFLALHVAACRHLGIDPRAHGASTTVAREIGVKPAQYHDAGSGHRGSLDLLCQWAGRLGLTVTVHPTGLVDVVAP